MTEAISKSIIDWGHTAFLEPAKEGGARITEGFRGVKLHNIDYPKLSCGKRIISIVTGLLLLIPLLNHIFWVFLRTFGNAEILSQPIHQPRVESWNEVISASEPVLSEIPALAPLEDEEPYRIQEFKCLDKTKYHPTEYEASCLIKSYAGSHIVTRTSNVDSSKAIYSPEWALTRLEIINIPMQVNAVLERSKNFITITGTKQGKKIDKKFPVEGKLPWIQQSMGFIPFVQSPTRENELPFYSIRPDELKLHKFRAEVSERGEYEEQGPLVKFNVIYPTTFKNFTIGTCWFNPTTGQQYKNEYELNILGYVFTWGKSRLKSSL